MPDAPGELEPEGGASYSPGTPGGLVPEGGGAATPGDPGYLQPNTPSTPPDPPPLIEPETPSVPDQPENYARSNASNISAYRSEWRTMLAGFTPSQKTTGALTLSDNGRMIYADGDISIPDGIFPTGAVLYISNTTGSAINVSSEVSLMISGNATVGENLQIGAYGFATVLMEPSGAKVIGDAVTLGYDSDAVVFFTAAAISDSGVKDAVSSLVTRLKTESLWTKFRAIYPMVQDPGENSLTPQSFNLKNPASNQITWNGSITPTDNGVEGAGGYGTTGINLNTTTANSLAFGFYSRNAADGDVAMGAHDGASDGCLIFPKYSGDNNAYFDNQYNGGAGRCGTVVADSLGLYVSSRTATNLHKGYKRGTAIATTTGAQGTLVSANFVLFKRDPAGFPSASKIAFAFVSSGLTDSEVTSLDSVVQDFQEALGRAV